MDRYCHKGLIGLHAEGLALSLKTLTEGIKGGVDRVTN
jgi:hypothetical protein